MQLHIYEPSLRAVHLSDDRIIAVPDEVLASAGVDSEIDAVRTWAHDTGIVAFGEDVGVFEPSYV
jgi:hypothetical protein